MSEARTHLTPIPAADSGKVRDFLNGVFGLDQDALFTASAQMQWKYWDSRPGWEGSRSFGLMGPDGELAAHLAAWPLELRTTGGSVRAIHPIDWAARAGVRGAGAEILRQVRVMAPVSICMGGTEIAQAVVRRQGYGRRAQLHWLACPLRPVQQARTHPRRNWKLPLRLLRNWRWSRQGCSAPAGWTADPVAPGEIDEALMPTPKDGLAVSARSGALLQYLARCPTARIANWIIRDAGTARGYFALSFVPGQARMIDAWVDNEEGWSAVFALAKMAALQDGSAAEFVAYASWDPVVGGAMSAGLRSRGADNVMIYDPENHLHGIQHVHLLAIDNDAAFLHGGAIDYVT